MIDVSQLRQGSRKLGLGSSAAAAAGAAGLVYAFHGHPVEEDVTRQQILAVALEGHHAVAPQGSGADVAAAVLGGFVRYRRTGVAQRVSWPDGIEARIVWTGQEARTSELVAQVERLREAEPRTHGRAIGAIEEAACDLIGALERESPSGVIQAVERHGRAMEQLGEVADAPIVESRLSEIMSIARDSKGAAKPSGAGGGDVAIAFFETTECAEAFEDTCTKRGMTLLSVGLGAPGLVLERQDR